MMGPLGDTGLRVALVGLGRTEGHVAAHLLSTVQPGIRVDVLDALAAIRREDLLARYHAVMYSVAEPADPPLSIPGANLPGCATALSFLEWCSGQRRHGDDFDLRCRRAIVIGDGSIALHVALTLAVGPEPTARAALADHVMAAFAHSRIEEIVVVGAAGPEQAAVTDPQLRELDRLAETDVVADPLEVAVPAEYRERAPGTAVRSNLALLHEYAARPRRGGRRRIALRFLLSPTRILGYERVQAIELVRNTLEHDPAGHLHPRATAARATIPAGLVLSAVNDRLWHSGVPVDGRSEVITDDHGRVRGADGLPTREYLTGRPGPSGVIGTDGDRVAETVGVLLTDIVSGRLNGFTRAAAADARAGVAGGTPPPPPPARHAVAPPA
jgi:ferredoxin--NADP+ reductase